MDHNAYTFRVSSKSDPNFQTLNKGKYTRGTMVIDRNGLILGDIGKAKIPAKVDIEKIVALEEMNFSSKSNLRMWN